jgi:hypothetical protein
MIAECQQTVVINELMALHTGKSCFFVFLITPHVNNSGKIIIFVSLIFNKILYVGTIPLYSSISCFNSLIDILIGVVFLLLANTAAAPATCPIPMHDACTLSAEFANRSLPTHLPATNKFLLFLGTKARNGIVATLPSIKCLGVTPCSECKSIG